MQAVVTADTHLSVSGRYLGIDGDRLAARRASFARTFEAVVDHALAVEPDLFIHCGDLFDVADPTAEWMELALDRVRALDRAGIVPVLVTGNHDQSRVVDGEEVIDPAAGSALDVFTEEELGIVFDEPTLRTEWIGTGADRLRLAGIGYDPTLQGEVDPLERVDLPPTDEPTILVTHHRIEGHDGGLDGWPIVRSRTIDRLPVDLVCSGHVHESSHFSIGDTTILVPGATERRSFEEATNDPGFATLSIGSAIQLDRHRVDAQPMVDLAIDVDSLADVDPTSEVVDRIESVADTTTLVRLTLRDPEHVVDRSAVERAGGRASVFELREDLE